MKKMISFFCVCLLVLVSNMYCQEILLYTLGDNVNIRSTPSTSATVVTKVEKFTEFIVEEVGKKETINGNTDYWYKVKFNEIEGWIFGHFTSLRQEGRKTLILKYIAYDFSDYDYPAMITFKDKSGKAYEFSSWTMPPMSFDLTNGISNGENKANPELIGKDFKLTINYLPYKFEDPSDGTIGIYDHWVCLEISEIK